MQDDAAKILLQSRKDWGLGIVDFSEEVNAFFPEPFQYSYSTYSRLERGVTAIPFYAFQYLAERATGRVQAMAQQVVATMRPATEAENV